jgi:anti-sigma factor RsiW
MMDHVEATRKFAVEQYLLGELSESEREEFEQHFFACPECAETLETGAALIANAREVFREPARLPRQASVPGWKRWLGLEWGFAPAAALAGCVLMLAVVGYQNLVQIPAMRQRGEGGDLAMAPAIAIRAARAPQALTFSRHAAAVPLLVVHEWEEPYSNYVAEVARADGQQVVTRSETAATTADLSILIRPGRLQTGPYTLTIYGLREGSAERTPVSRIPFTLTE